MTTTTWRTQGDYKGLAKESNQGSVPRKNSLQLVTVLFYNSNRTAVYTKQRIGTNSESARI